jgi:succinylarginine dihydrolase
MSPIDCNFDGLIGPTHNYSGLAPGNLAATRNVNTLSHPRAAALQGLRKMRRLAGLGIPGGVFPPHARPDTGWLRTLGFSGTDGEVYLRAWQDEPAFARASFDASAMWAANAATVSPSADTADGRLHISVANLQTMIHRSLEAGQTERTLRRLFPDERRFAVHGPLPAHPRLSDEGAANHMRLCSGGRGGGELRREKDAGTGSGISAGIGAGIEIFVYGRKGDEERPGFPARQSFDASRALARRHRLDPGRTIFIRQSTEAIDAGAFHNDVVAVSHENVLFCHERAFEDPRGFERELRTKAAGLFEPVVVEVPEARVPLVDAISSYLFNSQLIREPGAATLTLIAPVEVEETASTRAFVEEMLREPHPVIGRVEYVDVRESMRGGGGPACLRLRIPLTASERAAATSGFFLTDALADRLEAWVEKHYREELSFDDLRDPALIEESRAALDDLTGILPLGGEFYPFQRG